MFIFSHWGKKKRKRKSLFGAAETSLIFQCVFSRAVYIIFTIKVDGKGEAFVDIFQMIVSVCRFLQGAVSPASLSAFPHSPFLVRCCKINGSKSWGALPTVRKAPSVLLALA